MTPPKSSVTITPTVLELTQEFSIPSAYLINVELFATPWFSNAEFEERDVHFRLLLVVEPCTQVHPGHGSLHWGVLQVCTREQRDQAIAREKREGKHSRFSPADPKAESTAAHKMVFAQASLTVQDAGPDHLERGTRLVTPAEHFFPEMFQLHRNAHEDMDPMSGLAISFTAQVIVFTVPPIAGEDGDKEVPPKAVNITAPTTQAAASAMLGRLLDSGVLSDFTLRVGGEELRAHRCVLAAASPVFRRMLEHTSSAESLQGLVDVQGVRPEVMAAALRFLYGQELGAALDVDTLCDLLVLAERYELLELKENCDEQLARDDKADPLQLLTLAVRNNAPRLREAAVKRIAGSEHRESIINSSTVREVIRLHPEVAQELILKL